MLSLTKPMFALEVASDVPKLWVEGRWTGKAIYGGGCGGGGESVVG